MSTTNLSQTEKEELRTAVREQLCVAARVAFPADTIHRRVERQRLLDFDFTPADVADALALLVSLDHATQLPHELGATPHYQATAQGVLAYERGGRG